MVGEYGLILVLEKWTYANWCLDVNQSNSCASSLVTRRRHLCWEEFPSL